MNLNTSTYLSIARIVATGGVFTYHTLAILEIDVSDFLGFGSNYYVIGIFSLMTFCFLSGYLSYFGVRRQPLNWLCRRISTIMIPYWIVIIPVVLVNHIIQYKETTLLMDIVTVLGGNLFLDSPLYVIAWYITLVNLFYLFVFLLSLSKKVALKLMTWALGLICFCYLLSMTGFFVAFALGYFGARIIPPPTKDFSRMDTQDRMLFYVQDKCYAFFLIHGGVLILLFVKLEMTGYSLFWWGLLVTSIGAVILQKISRLLIRRVCGVLCMRVVNSGGGTGSLTEISQR